MLPFQKTSVYQEALSALSEVLKEYTEKESPQLKRKIEEESFSVTSNLAKAFTNQDKESQKSHLKSSVEGIVGIIALLDLTQKQQISPVKRELTEKLESLQSNLTNFKKSQKKILILSAKIGHGHMSAADAVAEALKHSYGYDYDVEIVDFVELLSSLMNLVTKKYYENSVKFAPSIYKILYESSNRNVQMVKLLNQVNYPFVLTKLKKFFKEKQPDLLISTFPIWNYLASEIWKKQNKDAEFISIVTDSITIHNSWVLADTDYHIVANDDTKESLMRLKVEEEKIKTLGFPVKLDFLQETSKEQFLKKIGLDPKKMTILFLPTSQAQRKNQKIMKDLVAYDEEMNLIIITGRDTKNKPRLEKIAKEKENVKVIGWTDKMPSFIKAADIVVTKAGGATVMECLAAGKPMVITSIIPGQEQGNAELIKRHGLGIISSASDNIAEHVDYIKMNSKAFQRNIQKMSNPNSALEIAEFIHERLSKRQ